MLTKPDTNSHTRSCPLPSSYAIGLPWKFEGTAKTFSDFASSSREEWFREFAFRVILPGKKEPQEKDLNAFERLLM